MNKEYIKPNVIIRGSIFPEPVQIVTSIFMGNSTKIIGKGLHCGKVHEPVLDDEKIAIGIRHELGKSQRLGSRKH